MAPRKECDIMPNCFQLTKKGEVEPSTLNSVDEAICEYVGAPVDEKKWYYNWYNILGLAYACGKSCEEVARITHEQDPGHKLDTVARFIADNYETKSWYEHK